LATRSHFADAALESRFISERTATGKVRQGIPANLPETFEDEARALRNKLLMYRFRNWRKIQLPLSANGSASRIAQIFRPLLAVAQNEADADTIMDYARASQKFLSSLSSHSAEEKILGVMAMLIDSGETGLAVSAITKRYAAVHGHEHVKPVTPKWVGGIIRNRLHLLTVKNQGCYVIAEGQKQRLEGLFERFNIPRQSTVAGPDCAESKAQSDTVRAG
jgi:hypothetical protein